MMMTEEVATHHTGAAREPVVGGRGETMRRRIPMKRRRKEGASLVRRKGATGRLDQS